MKWHLIFAFCLLISGCAEQVTQVRLVPSGIQRVAEPFDMELKTVTMIIAEPPEQTGNVRMRPDFCNTWRDALQTVVDQAGVFRDDASRKVTIAGVIKKFDFNSAGFSNKCDVEVAYKVIDRSNGQSLFTKTITSGSSKNVGETFNARMRIIDIWNEATQENIRAFVDALKESNIK